MASLPPPVPLLEEVRDMQDVVWDLLRDDEEDAAVVHAAAAAARVVVDRGSPMSNGPGWRGRCLGSARNIPRGHAS